MNDLDIIKQIEKELDIELKQLDTIAWNSKGYTVNESEQVTGLGLYQCNIENLRRIIFLLGDLSHLTSLNLTDNQISDLSPLNQFSNLTALYLRYNQVSDLSVFLIKLRKAIHWN